MLTRRQTAPRECSTCDAVTALSMQPARMRQAPAPLTHSPCALPAPMQRCTAYQPVCKVPNGSFLSF